MIMSKQYIILFLVLSFFFDGVSQNNINDYKYVVVPTQFDFAAGKDKYRMNTLTRYLFKQDGFLTFYDKEQHPEDLSNDPCLALYADVKNIPSSLSIKVKIELLDCKGNLVFVSDEGRTKVKSFEKGYPLAIREAFESVKLLDYKYEPSQSPSVTAKKSDTVNLDATNRGESQKAKEAAAEIERLQEEVNLLKDKEEKAKIILAKELVVKNEQIAKKKEVIAPIKVTEKVPSVSQKGDSLLANPINNGFQVVDASSKEIMVLLYSGSPDVYIVKGQDALVFKKGEAWMYSINEGSGLDVKEINLKF